MGMMRSPSTVSLATVGQPAMLTHKVREITILVNSLLSLIGPTFITAWQ